MDSRLATHGNALGIGCLLRIGSSRPRPRNRCLICICTHAILAHTWIARAVSQSVNERDHWWQYTEEKTRTTQHVFKRSRLDVKARKRLRWSQLSMKWSAFSSIDLPLNRFLSTKCQQDSGGTNANWYIYTDNQAHKHVTTEKKCESCCGYVGFKKNCTDWLQKTAYSVGGFSISIQHLIIQYSGQ